MTIKYLQSGKVTKNKIKVYPRPGKRDNKPTPQKHVFEKAIRPVRGRLTCTRSVDNLWKCTQCIVLQQLQHLEKMRETERKEAEHEHKAYLYTTWRYLTFQFNVNDTWLSREVQREQVCVCVPLRRKLFQAFLIGPGPSSTSEVSYKNISSPFGNPTPLS